ncbi:MAG: phosphoglycolate/pyridoxal phosphate family phosphatase [Thermofilaceae archaeon]
MNTKIKQPFLPFEGFILDCDGVLWRGDKPIAGAREAVKALKAAGKVVVFVTNNASLSRNGYLEKMRRMGFDVSLGDIYCSSYVTARVLRRIRVSRVYVVGEEGLVEELEREGIELTDPQHAECLVVGIDRHLTYQKLADALKCLNHGALFVATNEDPTLPVEDGVLPGAGAIVAALERASGRKPDVVIGKPSSTMFEMVLEEKRLDPSKTLVVGDRIDTDIAGAKRLGIAAALVLSGSTTLDELSSSPLKPDIVLASLSEILEEVSA